MTVQISPHVVLFFSDESTSIVCAIEFYIYRENIYVYNSVCNLLKNSKERKETWNCGIHKVTPPGPKQKVLHVVSKSPPEGPQQSTVKYFCDLDFCSTIYCKYRNYKNSNNDKNS